MAWCAQAAMVSRTVWFVEYCILWGRRHASVRSVPWSSDGSPRHFLYHLSIVMVIRKPRNRKSPWSYWPINSCLHERPSYVSTAWFWTLYIRFCTHSENMRWCALGSRKHYERHVVEQFQLVSVHKSLDTTAARYNAKCSCGFFPLFLFLEHGDVADEQHVHIVLPARTYCAHTEICTDWMQKT